VQASGARAADTNHMGLRMHCVRFIRAALVDRDGLPWRRVSAADDRVACQELGHRSCDGLGTLDL